MFPPKFPEKNCRLRLIAAFLALSISLPSPAFALRTEEPSQSLHRTGLEEALRSGAEEQVFEKIDVLADLSGAMAVAVQDPKKLESPFDALVRRHARSNASLRSRLEKAGLSIPDYLGVVFVQNGSGVTPLSPIHSVQIQLAQPLFQELRRRVESRLWMNVDEIWSEIRPKVILGEGAPVDQTILADRTAHEFVRRAIRAVGLDPVEPEPAAGAEEGIVSLHLSPVLREAVEAVGVAVGLKIDTIPKLARQSRYDILSQRGVGPARIKNLDLKLALYGYIPAWEVPEGLDLGQGVMVALRASEASKGPYFYSDGKNLEKGLTKAGIVTVAGLLQYPLPALEDLFLLQIKRPYEFELIKTLLQDLGIRPYWRFSEQDKNEQDEKASKALRDYLAALEAGETVWTEELRKHFSFSAGSIEEILRASGWAEGRRSGENHPVNGKRFYKLAPADGAEEKVAPDAGRAALLQVHPTLEQWVLNQSGVIETLAQGQPETVDLNSYYPDAGLDLVVREAGYKEGLLFVVPPAKLDSALTPGISMTVFVQDEEGWRKTVRDNLNLRGAVDKGEIRFAANPSEANVVIGQEDAIPLRPGQVFIGVNSQTIARVTLGLFNELEQKGLLEPGSRVMLYSAPKDSVLIFA